MPRSVTGVQLMQGVGVQESKGLWAEAWQKVLSQPRSVLSLAWISTVAFFALFAPILASGHPILFTVTSPDGASTTTSPLLRNLSLADALLAVGGLAAIILLITPLARFKLTFGGKLGIILAAFAQGAVAVILTAVLRGYVEQRELPRWVLDLRDAQSFKPAAAGAIALLSAILFVWIPTFTSLAKRAGFVLVVAAVLGVAIASTWRAPIQTFPYRDLQATQDAKATYTIVPWSPTQRGTNLRLLPPGSDTTTPDRLAFIEGRLREVRAQARTEGQARIAAAADQARADALAQGRSPGVAERRANDARAAERRAVESAATDRVLPEILREADTKYPATDQASFMVGTDAIGQDVLSNLLHACRLSISIGLVSTGIAVVIGVTIGALMGYFGGWIDIILFRVVETFMAIPVLFLLIVAAAVLPKNTYVMMAIIGCVTWTGTARFTRAEFMRLRNQDFVQAAKACGLPLRSILFRHMLPNGVTPVLVDASFAIAAAIQIEVVLSFLGLSPAEQPSWGRLLASATNEVGDFKWWLAIFPGAAIFLTALSYNVLGESLRDAMDPKLKKARV